MKSFVPDLLYIPDSKVHGTNMGPIWGRQDPGGPHVGPMKLAIWDLINAVRVTFIDAHYGCWGHLAANYLYCAGKCTKRNVLWTYLHYVP